jgi:hemolysin III
VAVTASSVRPLFRGSIHLLAAVVSPGALVALVLIADSARAVVGAAVFGTALVLLHATSAGYHVLRWKRLRRLDHAMIFVFIAGVFTPFTLKVLENAWGIPILSVTWGLAGIGVALALTSKNESRWLRTGPYLALGWVGLIPMYKLWQSLPHEAFALLLLGGLTYSLGGIVYATRRPDPYPAVFGYHEVFHSITLAATGMFYFVVARYVMP